MQPHNYPNYLNTYIYISANGAGSVGSQNDSVGAQNDRCCRCATKTQPINQSRQPVGSAAAVSGGGGRGGGGRRPSRLEADWLSVLGPTGEHGVGRPARRRSRYCPSSLPLRPVVAPVTARRRSRYGPSSLPLPSADGHALPTLRPKISATFATMIK